jgi:hypothetical protein
MQNVTNASAAKRGETDTQNDRKTAVDLIFQSALFVGSGRQVRAGISRRGCRAVGVV